uniref:Uncharacterized protein n=1 Tax=Triticum urartu TaxID=4572 RepID=A0A8R7Q5A3_TRIUA
PILHGRSWCWCHSSRSPCRTGQTIPTNTAAHLAIFSPTLTTRQWSTIAMHDPEGAGSVGSMGGRQYPHLAPRRRQALWHHRMGNVHHLQCSAAFHGPATRHFLDASGGANLQALFLSSERSRFNQ